MWSTLGWTSPAVVAPKDETLAMIYGRTRTRCRRVLEHLFRMQSAEVFESIIDWWSRDLVIPFYFFGWVDGRIDGEKIGAYCSDQRSI